MEYQNAKGNETDMACRPLRKQKTTLVLTHLRESFLLSRVGKYLIGNSSNEFRLILLGEKNQAWEKVIPSVPPTCISEK